MTPGPAFPRRPTGGAGLCPYCRKDAPLVYRGVLATCAACGRARVPLTAAAVNLAGQPSRVGGSVANVIGWVVLGVGLVVALLLGALFQAIFPAGFFGWVLGIVIALVAGGLGLGLVLGGRSLHRSGTEKERVTVERGLFALAQNRGGVLSALDVAQALALPPARADALLTDLAKTDPDRVRLEVDDAGTLTYVFPQALPPAPTTPAQQVRVAAPGERAAAEAEAAEEDADVSGASARSFRR